VSLPVAGIGAGEKAVLDSEVTHGLWILRARHPRRNR
jgi:hypothetical protein